MHGDATVATQGDGHRESDELADFRAKQIRLLASRAEGHISLDHLGAELADFFHAGRQLFAIVVPIEHHVRTLFTSNSSRRPLTGWRRNRSSKDDLLISELRHHTGDHVVEIVTVQRPSSRIVGIKSKPDAAHRQHQNSVAHGTLDQSPINCGHLEHVAVQMDRMRHHGAVDQIDLDALSLCEHERRDLRPILAVHGPCVRRHSATENDGLDDVRGAWRQRLNCHKPGLQRQVDWRRGFRAASYPRNVPTWCGEDDPGLLAVAFQPRENRKRSGPRQIDQYVVALGYRERETVARYWIHGMAVGRDHAADKFTKVDPKLTRRSAVDDPQADATAAFDAHDLRIC